MKFPWSQSPNIQTATTASTTDPFVRDEYEQRTQIYGGLHISNPQMHVPILPSQSTYDQQAALDYSHRAHLDAHKQALNQQAQLGAQQQALNQQAQQQYQKFQAWSLAQAQSAINLSLHHVQQQQFTTPIPKPQKVYSESEQFIRTKLRISRE